MNSKTIKNVIAVKDNLPTSQSIYDVFISYSTDPDYQLSRRVESFLESFHKLRTPKGIELKPLSVCRDGSDFSLYSIKKQASTDASGDEYVKDILAQYLQQTRYLLVLCSKNSMLSEYVQFEVDWFIQNKGPDAILLAVTEGENIKDEQTTLFSEIIRQYQLQTRPYYDLRSFKKESRHWQKLRDYKEELTMLAAHLNNQTSGNILPLWRREENNKLKKQRYLAGAAALVFLVLALLAFFQRQNAIRNERTALENLKRFKKEQFQRNMRNGLVYYNAQEYAFARKEFLEAARVISQYPEDSLLAGQKDTISFFLRKCGP